MTRQQFWTEMGSFALFFAASFGRMMPIGILAAFVVIIAARDRRLYGFGPFDRVSVSHVD